MRLIVTLALALLVAGCGTKSVFQGGTSLTAPIAVPAGPESLATVESTYGAVLAAAVNYRRLGLCRSGQTESMANVCARRDVVVALQNADRKAHAAVVAARNFVRNNPTISAVGAVGAAMQAVTDFQTVAATYGVK